MLVQGAVLVWCSGVVFGHYCGSTVYCLNMVSCVCTMHCVNIVYCDDAL